MRRSIKMSGDSYVFDTTVIIKIFGKDQKVIERAEECEEIFIPSIVIGELQYGAQNSKRKEENLEKIEQLSFMSSILHITEQTAKEYGIIKKELKEKGTPIPENDLWIAATAIQNDLKLAGRDKHFEHIDKLAYEQW